MARKDHTGRRVPKPSKHLLSSRIARLIFASNLAGLAILIIGAMVLNEMRASFVVAKKQDLVGQAQVFSNLLAEGATFGQPEPVMDEELARATLADLSLPVSVRGKVYDPDGELVGDSYFLSDRVIVSGLPPLQEPSQLSRWSRSLSEWAVSTFGALVPNRGGDAVRTQTFEQEYAVAMAGGEAASQRFNDRGQRIISVSLPVQHVSAVVGVLTLESNDIDEIIRAERAALIPFIGVAVLVALITSALLTIGIARPLRRLSEEADRVRSGSSQELNLPRITRRRDEIGALASSMEAMTEALFERITSNERFAADVAHEIKNPLTSIRSAVETAERVQDNPEAMRKLHKVIAHDVGRLDRLITDISNASRLEAEITRVPTETLNIARFVADIVATYEYLAIEDDQASVVYEDATMGAGLRVRGREGPLGQVIRNLIDNGLSFSPPAGKVFVRVEQGRIGPQTTARIIVEDEGPGIPDDKFEKIFERFYTDRPKGSAFGRNSGLGLSIVRQIANTHLGHVWAENRAEGGARFIVELPAT
ncbi:stimulus-sensing domain-containing protein [Henriciella litoralis]|uniref:stimulus-sensing domain-containing protein n=1 Tax=Henriciella litoralis TaxID=568102 RepID=UPI0009FEEA6B|nr:stimulus-sensing domain-containing protein [Henriciella litoralis]